MGSGTLKVQDLFCFIDTLVPSAVNILKRPPKSLWGPKNTDNRGKDYINVHRQVQSKRYYSRRNPPNMKYGPEGLLLRKIGVVRATTTFTSQLEVWANADAVERVRDGCISVVMIYGEERVSKRVYILC